MADALRADPHALDASRLAAIDGEGVRALISGWKREVPLQEERARLLREVGARLRVDLQCSLIACLEAQDVCLTVCLFAQTCIGICAACYAVWVCTCCLSRGDDNVLASWMVDIRSELFEQAPIVGFPIVGFGVMLLELCWNAIARQLMEREGLSAC